VAGAIGVFELQPLLRWPAAIGVLLMECASALHVGFGPCGRGLLVVLEGDLLTCSAQKGSRKRITGHLGADIYHFYLSTTATMNSLETITARSSAH
jgi:hypothetical protein